MKVAVKVYGDQHDWHLANTALHAWRAQDRAESGAKVAVNLTAYHVGVQLSVPDHRLPSVLPGRQASGEWE